MSWCQFSLKKLHYLGIYWNEIGPYEFASKLFLRKNEFKDSIPNYKYNVEMQTTCKFRHAK